MILTLLTRLAAWLPAPLRRPATPARLALAAQFFAFGCVGVFGLVLDTATVYATRHRLGLYGAGLLAYLVAATGNWILNRIWTFRGHGGGAAHRAPMYRQWGLFLATNALGFVLNRGVYAALITFVPACAQEPFFAILAGGLTGMVLNFHMSRSIVFRERPNI